MPSYRSILTVTTLARVPTRRSRAGGALSDLLESWDIAITAGQPRVTARFTAVDDSEARLLTPLSSVACAADVPRASGRRARSLPLPDGLRTRDPTSPLTCH